MKNIVLIGMPGAGKSTVGVLLAKTCLMDFKDTDLSIQREYSKSLSEIINEVGVNKFLQIENDVIEAENFQNTVVATGGSAVFGEKAMSKLKSHGIVVYLKVSCDELERRIDNIRTRGIAMKEGTTIAELYHERAPLYEKYADITIDCTSFTAEECVSKIKEKINI